jgi:hypothetical protein
LNPPPVPGGIGELSHKLILESSMWDLGPDLCFAGTEGDQRTTCAKGILALTELNYYIGERTSF